MKKIILIIITVSSLQTITTAQIEPIKLLGCHSITVESGVKTNSNTSVTTNLTGVDVKTGFIGSFCYGYWFDEEWAFTLSAGVFGAGVSASYNNVETNAVMPLLVGVKYYPTKLALGSRGRIYAGLALGDYVGTATKTKGISTEIINESVFGGQASLGVDLFVATWFRLGPKLSYYFLGDYSQIIGASKNLSGVAFSLEFGFVL
jgi:hypothetical protein